MYLIIFFIFTDNELIFRILLGLNLVSFVSHPAYYTRKYQLDVDNGSPNPGSGPRQKIASLLAVVGLVATFLYIINPGWMAWSSLPLAALAGISNCTVRFRAAAVGTKTPGRELERQGPPGGWSPAGGQRTLPICPPSHLCILPADPGFDRPGHRQLVHRQHLDHDDGPGYKVPH